MDLLESDAFGGPVASTSRAVFTLSYKPSPDIEEEEEEDPHLGQQLYEQAWGICSERIDSILASLHNASLDQIVQFVDDSRSSPPSLLATLSGRPTIRTGLIVGASPGSSSLLFTSLCRQLTTAPAVIFGEERPPCIVSRLTSRDCASIKSALRALIAGFLGSAPADDEQGEEGDEEEQTGAFGGAAASLAPEDLQNLVAWYQHRFSGKGAPSDAFETIEPTSSPAGIKGPTLVILLEDLEAMDARVLSLMFQTLTRYVSRMPIVFLVGIATAATALTEAVSRRISNLLETTTFFVEPGVGAFNALARGLFVDWIAPLSLGVNAYQYLWKTFEDMHHSIDAVISSIQYLYMHHYTTKSHAIPTAVHSPDNLHHFDNDFTACLHVLPSVQDFLQSLPQDQRGTTGLLGDGRQTVDVLARCQDARDTWQRDLKSGFAILLVLQDFWEKKLPMQKTLLRLAEGSLCDHSDEVCGMVLHSTSVKLVKFLEVAVEELEQLRKDDSSLSADLLEALKQDSETLKGILAAPREAGRQNLINDNGVGSQILHPSLIAQVDRDFSKLARKVSETIRNGLRHSFRPASDLLLHELWFENDLYPLKKFHPSVLPSFHKALDAPLAPGELEPDIAVAYRLYRETGKTINLGDWWRAFEQSAANQPDAAQEDSVKRAQTPKRRKGASDDEDDERDEDDEEANEDERRTRRKQARFLRAIGDLACVGFLQPTSRKAEHVLKSVF